MRLFIILMILILSVGAIYVVYNIITFEPTPIFPVPISSDETLSLEIDKEIVLTPEQSDRKDRVLEQISSAIERYETDWADLPRQAEGVKSSLMALMKSGYLPALYPHYSIETNSVQFQQLRFNSDEIREVFAEEDEEQTEFNCKTGQPKQSILIGDNNNNKFGCVLPEKIETRLVLSGPGDDVILMNGALTVVDAGPGDDKMSLGPEQTIVMVSEGFGYDEITMDCSLGAMTSNQDKFPWDYDFAHFIVFGPFISREDVVITGNEIKNIKTEETIRLSQNCFNLVFVNDLGAPQPR